MRHAVVEEEERTTNQINLFGAVEDFVPDLKLPNAPNWEPMERLQHEFDATASTFPPTRWTNTNAISRACASNRSAPCRAW